MQPRYCTLIQYRILLHYEHIASWIQSKTIRTIFQIDKSTKISIITVNYNQAEVTLELLASIKRQSFQDVEVIVVDNASRENRLPELKVAYPDIITIRSEENLGFSGGNNLGIESSTGDFLFFVNNDAEILEGTIPKLLACFERVPKLGIVSPMIHYYQPEKEEKMIQYAGTVPLHAITGRNFTIGKFEIDRGQYNEAKPTAHVHGAAMMVKREVIEKVGGMPEEFFLYYEELDWSDQIRRAGFEVYIEPNAKIYHKESVSVGKQSDLQIYYTTRNRIYYMRRNKKAWEFALFSLYIFAVMLPRHAFGFIRRGQFKKLSILWRAIAWNYFGKRFTFSK
ncbi:MAG: glycosyltransferase family 2 protein [Bacteroidota bacterium]